MYKYLMKEFTITINDMPKQTALNTIINECVNYPRPHYEISDMIETMWESFEIKDIFSDPELEAFINQTKYMSKNPHVSVVIIFNYFNGDPSISIHQQYHRVLDDTIKKIGFLTFDSENEFKGFLTQLKLIFSNKYTLIQDII